MAKLYPHQVDCIVRTRDSLVRGRKHPMLMAPTGFGKTVVSTEIILSATSRGKRVAFLVPSIVLVDQTLEKFLAEGIRDIGVMQGDHPAFDPFAMVQIVTPQTLARRNFPDVDLVLVDEAHEQFKSVYKWMQAKPDLPFIGLSATPWSKGLGKFYDDLIIAATTADLIRHEYLSPFKVYAPTHPDLSKVRVSKGDFDEAQLGLLMNDPKLVADIVPTWLEKAENRPTLCFCVNRAHARAVMDDFERAGVAVAYVDKDTERDDRRRIGEQFNAGHIRVVCNVGVLVRGVDWDVRCIILARPTKSETRYVQIIGRGLRTAPGKDYCLILDHSDTTLNLGLVTDIHHTSLPGGDLTKAKKAEPKAKSAKLPKECPQCQFVKPAGVHKCPECGFAPAMREDVETADGQLVLVNGKARKPTKADKQAFWSGLRWYMVNQGRPEKWALAKYKAWSGEWPSDNRLKNEVRPPDTVCRNYVISSFIRWQKGQRRKDRAGVTHAA